EESIVFRGDMDALPISEAKGPEYISSHPGQMHACGHDGHMAILLGLAEKINVLKSCNYNILLLFQPAEETILGALEICKAKLFSQYRAKYIFGLHLWPTLPQGKVVSRPGYMMAHSTQVDIHIEGLSAHCGEPEKGKDALATGCKFISELYDFVQFSEIPNALIQFGKMESGQVRNAISAQTTISGTMRTFEDSAFKTITGAMNSLANELSEDYGCKINVDYSKDHPAVVNDEQLYQRILPMLTNFSFEELDKPVMIAEDFSFFQKELPGLFFFLGTGSNIPLHSQNYDFDEKVLDTGVALFLQIATSLA
ncbi:MAG: M20 family metallopeptidase, partial [Anaerovoracaceae bacterium]